MSAPLARYKTNIVGFVHDLTPLRLTEIEQRILRQFEEGYRSGLGLKWQASDSLVRTLYLSYAVIAWKTLCFEHQLTGIYGRSLTKALPWINGFSIFVGQCDPLVRHYLQFDVSTPRVTLPSDDYWRIMLFNPNESELEHAKNWLTNVVYYDFDKIPEWLIRETQHALHRENSTQPVTLAIFHDRKAKIAKAEPTPYVDGNSSDSDD